MRCSRNGSCATDLGGLCLSHPLLGLNCGKWGSPCGPDLNSYQWLPGRLARARGQKQQCRPCTWKGKGSSWAVRGLDGFVRALAWNLMLGPGPSVDSGFSSAPYGAHRSGAALGPHLYTRSRDLPTSHLVNAAVCWGELCTLGLTWNNFPMHENQFA